MERIKCIQINLQRSKKATGHLVQYILTEQIDVVFIQEPYVIKGKVCGFPNRFYAYYTPSSEHPKTAIIVTNTKLQTVFVRTFSNDIMTVLSVKFENKIIYIFNTYFSPNNNLNFEISQLQTAIDVIKPNYFIVTSDTNVHSHMWFDSHNDQRGEQLETFIAQNNLFIINNNEETPTFQTLRGKSSIDITLTNMSLCGAIKNWSVLDIESVSDHKYISFEFNETLNEIKYKSTYKYNTKKANWDRLLDCIEPQMNELETQIRRTNIKNELELIVKQFTVLVAKVCDENIPKIKPVMNPKSNNWWNEELENKKKQINCIRRRFQNCQTRRRNELKLEYLRECKEYTDLLEKTKILNWNQFVEHSTKTNPWGIIYNIAKQNDKKIIANELIGTNGELITNGAEITKTFSDTLFPYDSSESDSEIQYMVRMRSEENYENIREPDFNVNEVTQIVNGQNHRKSPGEDGITADVVRKIHERNPTFLTILYNKCLELNVFPKIWKSGVVKVIPKPDKKDYRNPNSYRPITLLSVYAKIFEKLIINRIVYLVRKHHKVSDKQFGFTPQTSTEDALHSVVNTLKTSLKRIGFALVVSLDINGAFNYCWWPKILNQLRNKNCPKNLFLLLKSYLSERSCKVWHLNEEYEREINLGCPQGSASGPWLWNIMFDDIFELNDTDVLLQGFADDLILIVYAKSIEELQQITNEKLEKIKIWAKNNKITFNVEKTNCVLFTRKLRYYEPIITFDGQRLKLVKSFKYLGLIIDSKLSWREHTIYVRNKVNQFLNKLLQFSKNKFGLNTRAIETIYKGAILPMIGYACSVWYDGIDRKFIIKPLESIQRLVGLRISRAYKTVSNDALNVIANLLPVDLWLKGRATEYFVKKNINNKLVEKYLVQTNIDMESIQRPVDVRELKHITKRNIIETINSNNNNTRIMTDGIKSTYGTGSAFTVWNGSELTYQKKYKISQNCSEFQAKLYAIYKCIQFVNQKMLDSKVVICSPSIAIINAIKDTNSTNKLIFDIYEQYYSAYNKSIDIHLSFVDKHIEQMSQTRALSVEACKAHTSIEYDLVPLNTIKKIINEKNMDEWNKRWAETGKGQQTKLFIKDVRERRKMKYFTTTFYVTQLISNHGKFMAYLARFNLSIDPNCDTCGLTDDANHRLYECVKYRNEREEFKTKLSLRGVDFPIEQNVLINKRNYSDLCEYAEQILV
jgi:hypothetical protein